MFCTKCGKKLHDGDIFCAHCGTKVRDDLLFKSEEKSAPRATRFDEVVFNPPFKAEAERRTQYIEEAKSYSSEPKKESIHFNWNLDGFPASERKKEEDFVINWDSVIERRKEDRAVTVEKILPESGFKTEVSEIFIENKDAKKLEEPQPIIKEEPKKEPSEEPLSIEELEKALFGTADFNALDENMQGVTIEYKTFRERTKDQEFFTYNAKRDAFQELLDKEKARLEELENERNLQWEELTSFVPSLKVVDVVVPPLTARVMASDPQNIIEPEYQVVLPPLTARVEVGTSIVEEVEAQDDVQTKVDVLQKSFTKGEGSEVEELCPFLDEEGSKTVIEEEKLPEGTEEKTKLRYSDIFPVDAFDTDGDEQSHKRNKKKIAEKLEALEENDEDDDDEEEGGNGILKAIIVLLAIIVVLEIGIVGIKLAAPDSGIALKIDELIGEVTGIFSEEETSVPDIEIEQNLTEKYVKELSGEAKNIGTVNNDAMLKYDLSKTHSFGEIEQTNEFQDVTWNDVDNKTNGYLIVKAIISYYDAWKANNPDSEIVGINQVTIGEIRTGSSGYYVLNKVVYAMQGEIVEKHETIYLEASQDKITVKEVKEEII